MIDSADSAVARQARQPWLDGIKAIALLGIFLNHVVERSIGYPSISNPTENWWPLARRVAQLAPLSGYGSWDVPYNALRYLGFAGEIGVQLFLTASGFGLAWSLLRKGSNSFGYIDFLRKRASRIYPTWWVVHGLALLASIPVLVFIGGSLTREVVAPWHLSFYLSLAGLRVTPTALYYIVPAWWFIGLILQLYLVFPFLWRLLNKLGPLKFLVLGTAVSWLIRGLGLIMFQEYLDAWSRGAIFITRLPEFLLGMSLAVWFHTDARATDRLLISPLLILAAGVSIGVGFVSALTLVGNTWSPFLLGAGFFVLFYALLRRSRLASRTGRAILWISVHSYALYLVHHPIVYVLTPSRLDSPTRVWTGILLAVLFTGVGAIVLEWIVSRVEGITRRWKERGVLGQRAIRVGAAALIMWAGLIAGSELVRQRDPQEVLGWGERPSLEKHEVFGWTLKPAQVTRLRWMGYDYVVTANAMGFPDGSANATGPNSLRILTVGDAFTSAEGVDTGESWPRLLEGELAAASGGKRGVDVLNFGITGYSTYQFASVVESYAPSIRPQIIIVQMYLNDFGVAPRNWDAAWEGIGFDLPDPDSYRARIQFPHLAKYLRARLTEPLLETAIGLPRRTGYWLGGFAFLERGAIQPGSAGVVATGGALRRIADTARRVGASVIVVLAPASVQVCDQSELPYYPRNVELADSSLFDPEQPQRVAADLSDQLGVAFIDLRAPLRGLEVCPFHPENLHWKREGHQAVARHLAALLASPR